MFDLLTDRLSKVLGSLSGKRRLSEQNIESGLREIRLALLEANTSMEAVRGFTESVKTSVLGGDVVEGTSSSQTFVKRIHEGLVDLLSAGEGGLGQKPSRELNLLEPNRTTSVLLSGLQGSGKTTLAGKLAFRYKKKRDILLVSLDVRRPAAEEQLAQLGRSVGVQTYERLGELDAKALIKGAFSFAKRQGKNLIFFDTAGRTDVDDEMMKELQLGFRQVAPTESIYVCDAMAGQRALDVARTFGEAIRVDSLCFAKADADSRGGSILSTKYALNIPIKFLGSGEGVQDLDVFDPERMAGRLLGKGDIVGFVERAESMLDEKDLSVAKPSPESFDLQNLLDQLGQFERLGSVEALAKYLPGMNNALKKANWDPKELVRMRSVIQSMTPKERQKPFLLNGSRRQRLAKGSGRTVLEVNKVLKKCSEMKNLMQKMKNPSKLKALMKKRLGNKVGFSEFKA